MIGVGSAIEQAARALWDYGNADMTPEWRDSTWSGMSGSEPSEEYIEHIYRARALADAGLLASAPPQKDWAAVVEAEEFMGGPATI